MNSTTRIRRWWTDEEDQTLRREAEFQLRHGNLSDWNRIAAKLPGRTNKDCRKRWDKLPGHIKKGAWSTNEDQRLKGAVEMFGHRWTPVAQSVGTRNADQCAKRWHHSLDPSLDHSQWTAEDDGRLLVAVAKHGRVWKTIKDLEFPSRSATELKNRYVNIDRKLQQRTWPSANRATSLENGLPTPTMDLTDVEDSDSNESLSHGNTTDFHSTHPATTPNTTPGSYLDPLRGSYFNTPSPFNPTEALSPQAGSINYPFKALELNNAFASIPESNEALPDDFFFDQHQSGQDPQQDPLNPQNHTDSSPGFDDNIFRIDPSWDIPGLEPPSPPSPPPPTQEPEETTEKERATGSSQAMNNDDQPQQQDVKKTASTLVLEDIQPEMITKIINVLFEAQATVKMKIVSQEQRSILL